MSLKIGEGKEVFFLSKRGRGMVWYQKYGKTDVISNPKEIVLYCVSYLSIETTPSSLDSECREHHKHKMLRRKN